MNDLSQRLKDAVPTPPDPTDLSGIAARSAVDGRRRRTQRRLASVAAVVVLAVGGVVLPRVLSDGPPDVAERSVPDCVASPDAPIDAIRTRPASWVRFCELPTDVPGDRLRVPRGVVPEAIAAVMVDSWADWMPEQACGAETPPAPSRVFRIQIGLADGTVAEFDGDTGCIEHHLVFMQLPATMQGGVRRDDTVDPRGTPCPTAFDTTAATWDGSDAALLRDDVDGMSLATAPLLPGSSAAMDVCAFTGEDRTLVDQWRADLHTDVVSAVATGYRDGAADCPLDPEATSYLVVLQDFTGTARSFTIDMTACGEMRAAIGTPAVDTYLGLATNELVEMVRDSKGATTWDAVVGSTTWATTTHAPPSA
ncbi:hypothetical protein [Nocardioides hwasunensis]|uniref:Septum formation-related domain-containing protein n=1 Tax=Nocardioides hwasunensis TaxID=397258 RepID=A0ABR8MP75_9ACTN|nr:hypothetical protein [Nocardioides hwasunensis]MBD3916657.1 hypothetical protein [Nocardioides hwasunensis]